MLNYPKTDGRIWSLVAGSFFLLSMPVSVAQPVARREFLNPSYQHDRWNTQPKDQVRGFRAFTTSVDGPDDNDGDGRGDRWAVPEWVSYELRKGPTRKEYEPRPGTWHTDLELYCTRLAPRDQSYVNSGYDLGHLCMRLHARRLGQNADWNTHSVLNAVPQVHQFNAGHWLSLEMLCAAWANQYDKIWVICGPVMHTSTGRRRPWGWVGENGEVPVAIPHALFKIVVREGEDPTRPDVLAFLYENDAWLNSSSLDTDHTPYLKSVREIEQLTGLNFFASLSRADQNAIEANSAEDIWPHVLFGAPRPDGVPDENAVIERLYIEDAEAELPASSSEAPAEHIEGARQTPCSPTIMKAEPPSCKPKLRWWRRDCFLKRLYKRR
jgi:endonuclease G